MESLSLKCFIFLLLKCVTYATEYYEDYEVLQPFTPVTIELPGLGTILSGIANTIKSRSYFYKFLDINYALSPSGVNRFQPPVEVRSWSGVLDASLDRLACPSWSDLEDMLEYENEVDLEDCLTLSVYTRNVTAVNSVLVYIHGDFFFDGSSLEADPRYFLENDVVLVAVQYRLAPVGFISTLSNQVPGNVAVLDVIAALQWVKRNIRYFGGNPSSVTVFGQGSGATLAHLLTLSPAVPKDLFQQIILQSGSAFSPYFFTKDPVKYARDIARRCQCPYLDTIYEVNACLVRSNITTLLKAFQTHGQENEALGVGHFGGFQLTIGDPLGILPVAPQELHQRGAGRAVPMIGGVTRTVGSFLFKKIVERNPQAFRGQVHPVSLVDIVLRNTVGVDSAQIQPRVSMGELFSQDELRNGTFLALAPGLISLTGNVLYKTPVLEALKANAAEMPSQTFLYSFDYRGEFHRYNFNGDLAFDVGVSFTDDNLYLFPFPNHAESLNERDLHISDLLVELWTSFAATGSPRQSQYQSQWLPLTQGNGPYYHIDEPTRIDSDFRTELKPVDNEVRRPTYHRN